MTDVLPAAPAVDVDEASEWLDVCGVEAVTADRGVAALVHGVPVAIFRLAAIEAGAIGEASTEQWFCVDHVDPRTGAPVMARGLVGSTTLDGIEVPTIASPLHKQRYDLRTGAGLGDETTSLRAWPVTVFDGRVLVAASEMSPA